MAYKPTMPTNNNNATHIAALAEDASRTANAQWMIQDAERARVRTSQNPVDIARKALVDEILERLGAYMDYDDIPTTPGETIENAIDTLIKKAKEA